jgi:hypothetical protein
VAGVAQWKEVVMFLKLRPRLTYANVTATGALVVAMSGFAIASIPGPSGVVKGCYSKSSGSLRVIDSKKSCSKKHERTLSWNQRGVQGLQGAQGGQGIQGIPGTARAYAMVLPGLSPSFETTRTKNFSTVTHHSTGVYCLTPSGGVTEAGSVPVVAVEEGNSTGDNLAARWHSATNGQSCTASQFEVHTFTFVAGGNYGVSDNVAFTIVVP